MVLIVQAVVVVGSEADHGNDGADLNERPKAPVELHEVLTIAVLQRQRREGLHDSRNRGSERRHRGDGHGDVLALGQLLLLVLEVLARIPFLEVRLRFLYLPVRVSQGHVPKQYI